MRRVLLSAPAREAGGEEDGVEEEAHGRELRGAEVGVVGEEDDLPAAGALLPEVERAGQRPARLGPDEAGQPQRVLFGVGRDVLALPADLEGVVGRDGRAPPCD